MNNAVAKLRARRAEARSRRAFNRAVDNAARAGERNHAAPVARAHTPLIR